MRLPSSSGITSPRLVYVKGADARFASNDEPELFSQEEHRAADLQRNADKASGALFQREADQALEMQIDLMRREGAI